MENFQADTYMEDLDPDPKHLLKQQAPERSESAQSVKKMVQMLGPIVADLENNKKQKKDVNNDDDKDHHESILRTVTPLNFPQLEESMDTYHFEQLMTSFSEHVPEEEIEMPRSRLLTRESRRTVRQERKAGLMTLAEFQKILAKLLKVPLSYPESNKVFKKQSEMLFKKVDRNHSNEISWDEFCAYIMLKCQEKDHARLYNTLPFVDRPHTVRIQNVKETISRVVPDMMPTKYIAVSKEGLINILGPHLDVVRTFEMDGTGDEDQGGTKRRTKLWVTDAMLMANASKLVISTTNRDLWFYDLSTPVYKPQFLVCAIPDIPMCMDYYFDKKNKAAPSLLLFGTDNGEIHLLTFHTPTKGLFETPFKKSDSCWQMFFKDLPQHHKKVSHLCLTRVHSDWIRRIRYLPQAEMLISCSSNGRDSLVFRDIDESKRKTYIFKVSKGIDCFDFNKELNILVTGGVDHVVRLWDPYVTQKPMALLKGHQTFICDVHIYEKLDTIFSFSKDGDLRAWDIKEHCCMQHIVIRLPMGNTDHGPYPIFRASKSRLFLSVDNCLVIVKINTSQIKSRGNVTHEKPLCGAIYNPQLNQVITGSEDSNISIWDLESGQLMSTMSDIHDQEELSCIAIDKSCRRLITATKDGSAAIWNIATGLKETTLEPFDESEITDIIHLPDRNLIASVGWSRRILMHSDAQQEVLSVGYETTWACNEAHKDDVLSIAYYPPNVIATSSFNGEIKLWCMDRERLLRVLRKGNADRSRITSLTPLSPVDKLLFLKARSQHVEPVLLSSIAGLIEFWCLYLSNEPKGSFFAATGEDASILAMCTNAKNSVLVTGDTSGWVSIWDISEYCLGMRKYTSGQKVPSDQTFITAIDGPKRMFTFEAHSRAVVTTTLIERPKGDYVITASSDCTAKLFNMKGEMIGMFGQSTPWELSKPIQKRITFREKMQTTQETDSYPGGVQSAPADLLLNGDSSLPDTTLLRRPVTTSSLPEIGSSRTNASNDSIAKDIQVWNKNEYYRSRTMILDSISRKKNMWSFLGENYNDNAKRRMNDRRHRRENLPWIETSIHGCKKMGGICSPLKALQTVEARDPVLPKDLPVTTRMLRKGIDLSHPETLESLSLNKEKDRSSFAPLL